MKMFPDSMIRKNWASSHREVVQNWQLDRLRRYLKSTVLPFSKHYRDLGIDPDSIRTLEDLQSIPFTRKRDLLPTDAQPKRSRDFVLIPDEAVLRNRPSTIANALLRGKTQVKEAFDREFRPIFMTSTTGRATEPVPFLYTAHDLDNLRIAGIRLMEICDSRREFRHLNLFPFAPHLAFWQAHYAGVGFNTFALSTGGGKVMGTDGNVALIKKIEPDALIGMPTFIYHVLQEAAADGVRFNNLQRIVLGGEKVPDGMRRKLRSLAAEIGSEHVDVLATYGFTEAKMAWPECPGRVTNESTGYHLYPDFALVEVVNPLTGEPVDEGSPGEIVFTPLDARGSVVLRYRTGDEISGGLTWEPCPDCGRRIPRLVGNISRVTDAKRLNLGKLKGTLVNFGDLEHLLDDIDEIGSWQLEIRHRNDDPLAGDELIVHVHPSSPTIPQAELTERIRRQFYLKAEIRPNSVQFHSAKDIRQRQGVGTNLKEDKVIDRRSEAQKPNKMNKNLATEAVTQ